MNRFTNILVAFTLIFFAVSCEKELDPAQQEMKPTLIETIPGGCNTNDLGNEKNAMIENDTVYFSLSNDTVKIFTGINYICCAPFDTDVCASKDSILISLNDTCQEPNQSCYCRCNCYYTWEFLFADFIAGTYFLKIDLNDPRQNNSTVIWESSVEIKN